MSKLTTLRPDPDRLQADLDDLSCHTENATPGWTRRVFSEPYRASRDWVAAHMLAAGLEVHRDPVGNVVGVWPGQAGTGRPLVTGSHTDTVHGGGRYDGIVGVVGAIELVRALRESGIRLNHDLVVVDFLGEEANDFGVSCLGSRALAGILTAEHLDRVDAEGRRLGDVMAAVGLDPGGALGQAWKPGSVHAYLELHVEQGPLLESRGVPIGVVTAIAGIERLLARFVGRADHAGTMPMDRRADALLAAAESVLIVEREGCGAPIHGVATTGRLESSPGALNVVPDKASLWAELRSTEAPWLEGAKGRVVADIAKAANARGVEVMVEWLNDQAPVPTSRSLQDVIGRASDRLGHTWAAVPSGAGHDAAHLAELGPMGMIFVPSTGGRSHCPEEFTPTGDIIRGIEVLGQSLVDLDEH